MMELIEEVLDFSKIESGELNLKFELLNAHSIINEVYEMMLPFAKERGISLKVLSDPSLPLEILSDRIRLKELVINLVSNGIKYNYKNGSVTVEYYKTENDQMEIKVSDTGKGIKAEDLDKLFEPFNRLDATNSNELGTGLGLSIVKKITKNMDGEIYVKSEVGKGSTFTLVFPLRGDAKEISN